MGGERGSICFFPAYRPAINFDIYSLPYPSESASDTNELCVTDSEFSNYNGQAIPQPALKNMLLHPKLSSVAGANPENISRGLVFVSDRSDGLETLHIVLEFHDQTVKVVNFAEVYETFGGVRLEDSACFTDDFIIYVSTKDDPGRPHQPWTAVYQTHLVTGESQRLTPPGM